MAIAAETSPFSESFDDSVLFNLWRGLHLFPALAAWSAGGHAGNDLVFLTALPQKSESASAPAMPPDVRRGWRRRQEDE